MDQASELRKLVLRSLRDRAAATEPPPHLIVLAGGKGGVGVTSLGVNLAVVMAEQGARVVAVDADLYRSDVAAVCGIADRASMADLLAARRDIHEVLQPGPAGVQVVPGIWAPGKHDEFDRIGQERLLRQFRQLGPHADFILLDMGSGSGPLIRRFCAAADDLLLVTTPDPVAVMDTYARVKSSIQDAFRGELRLIVNRCNDAGLAQDVQRRLDHSLRRFLGMRVALLGAVPDDAQVRLAMDSAQPFAASAKKCPAAQAIRQLAKRMLTPIAEQTLKAV
jgi:flagellar biosynthesis protein FlhG